MFKFLMGRLIWNSTLPLNSLNFLWSRVYVSLNTNFQISNNHLLGLKLYSLVYFFPHGSKHICMNYSKDPPHFQFFLNDHLAIYP